jgi:hypothetical protein
LSIEELSGLYTCVQRIRIAYTTVPTLAVLSFVNQTTRLRAYVQRKIKGKINQKQKKFKIKLCFSYVTLLFCVCPSFLAPLFVVLSKELGKGSGCLEAVVVECSAKGSAEAVVARRRQ